MTTARPLPPDAAVPHLDRLLDAAAMRDVFGAHLDRHVEGVEPIKIKYRVGDCLRVVYRVGTDAGTTWIAGRTFASFRPQSAHRTAHNGHVRGAAPAFAAPELAARFWVFPDDRRLGKLRELVEPTRTLRSRVGGAWVRSRLAGYAPEKCAVVACLDDAGTTVAFAKQYASRAEAQQAFRLHRALASATPGGAALRLPRALAIDPEANVVFTEPAQGIRFTDDGAADGRERLYRLGAAVATLHAAPPPRAAPEPARFSEEAVRAAAALVARVMPSAAGAVARLASALAARAPAADAPVALHGDLHMKNALLDQSTVWLIDLDQAARGAASTDIGSVMALFRSHATAGLLPRPTARLQERAFLAGYASVGDLPSAPTLEWHVAAALLTERAVRAITRVRRPLLASLDRLIDEAHRALRKAGSR